MDNGKVISFINMKGGVGKTTLCKEVGFHLAKKREKEVLFIDVDPQINLTQALFKRYGYLQKRQINVNNEGDLIENKKTKESAASIQSILSYTGVTPPTIEEGIQNLDKGISIVPGELGLDFSLRNLNSSTLENGIYEYIKKNNLREMYNYILIDCPPTYSSYTVSALLPSDFYLVPAKPEGYSILGIDMLLQVIDYIVKGKSVYFENKQLHNLGVIFTDVKKSPSQGILNTLEKIRKSKELKELYFFQEPFTHNAQLAKDIDYFIDASNSDQSKSNIELIVDELIERMCKYE